MTRLKWVCVVVLLTFFSLRFASFHSYNKFDIFVVKKKMYGIMSVSTHKLCNLLIQPVVGTNCIYFSHYIFAESMNFVRFFCRSVCGYSSLLFGGAVCALCM